MKLLEETYKRGYDLGEAKILLNRTKKANHKEKSEKVIIKIKNFCSPETH